MVGIFEDQHWEYGFVGRADKLKEAQDAWTQHKQIFGIYGFKSVGKTRFAKELILRQELVDGNVYKFDFSGLISLDELIIHVVNEIGPHETLHKHNWIVGVCYCLAHKINQGCKKELVLFIDNAEDVDENNELKSAFMMLCQEVIKVSRCIKVIFTSTVKFRFAHVKKVYQAIELHKLSMEESRLLFREVINGMDLDGQEDKIIELCCGLPLALMIAGSELTEDEQQLSPKELVSLLEISKLEPMSREHYSDEEKMGKVIGSSISRLGDILQQHYASINYIPGTFNKDAATAILDFNSNAQTMDKAIIPLGRRCLVSYDSGSERFDIHDMQREFVMNNIRIRDIFGVRTRFCHFYSDCLVQLQKKVDSKNSEQALVPINQELKNFKKLLETAANCAGDGSYDDLMKAATEANYLIQFYLPGQVVSFYQVMMEACEKHGTEFDIGVMMSFLGEMVSENLGDYQVGVDWYWKAEQRLLPFGDSRRLAEVYQHIGWHHYRKGNGEEAIRYLNKSLRMLKALQITEDLQIARVMDCLGVVYVLIGKVKEAEKYHHKSLEMRLRLVGEKHLNIAMHYNNVGLMYELKEDFENAIKYYEKSYKLKLEIVGPCKTAIVTMRNLCLQWIRFGDYQKALDLVQENLETIDQVPDDDQTSKGHVLKVQGAAYLGMGEYVKAEDCLKQLLVIQKGIIPGHRTLVKTLTDLGTAVRKQGRLHEAETFLEEAYAMKSAALTCRGKFLFENLREFARLYLDSGDLARASHYYQEALSELHRLGDQLMRENDENKSRIMVREMQDLLLEIGEAHCTGIAVVPQPCDEALKCCLRAFADIIQKGCRDQHLGMTNSHDISEQNTNLIHSEGNHANNSGQPVPSDSQCQNDIPYWTTGHVYPSYVPQPYLSNEIGGTDGWNSRPLDHLAYNETCYITEEVDCPSDSRSATCTEYFADMSMSGHYTLPSRPDSWVIEQQTALNTCYHASLDDCQLCRPRSTGTPLSSDVGFWLNHHPTAADLADSDCAADAGTELRDQTTSVVRQFDLGTSTSDMRATVTRSNNQAEGYISSSLPVRQKALTESCSSSVCSENLYLGASDTEESFMKALYDAGLVQAPTVIMANFDQPHTPSNAIENHRAHSTTHVAPPKCQPVGNSSDPPRNPYRRPRPEPGQFKRHNNLMQSIYPPDTSWHPPHSDLEQDHRTEPNRSLSNGPSVHEPVNVSRLLGHPGQGHGQAGMYFQSPDAGTMAEKTHLQFCNGCSSRHNTTGGEFNFMPPGSDMMSQTAVKSVCRTGEVSFAVDESGTSSSLFGIGSWLSVGKRRVRQVLHV